MKILLIANAALLIIALVQAVGAITAFSRPLIGLAGFFIETLLLALSATAAVCFGGEEGLIVAWCLTGLAALIVLAGFRSWCRLRRESS
jgi:hypothetical protein